MRLVGLMFSILLMSSAAQAQNIAHVSAWRVNPCQTTYQAVDCNCYADVMLCAANQANISAMLRGQITPNMQRMDGVAVASVVGDSLLSAESYHTFGMHHAALLSATGRNLTPGGV